MSTPEMHSYEEFWPYYLRAHSKGLTRFIHAAGTTAAVASLAAFALTGRKRFLLAVPIVGYAPAWYSHFFIEGNKPATFGHPLWSLRGDFEMIVRMLTGTLDAELERHLRPEAASDAAGSASVVGPTNGHSHDHGAPSEAAPDTTLN